MGLLARVAAAVRSVFGSSSDGDASARDGADDGADADPAARDDGAADAADAATEPATTDCAVCGTTFETDADACPLCGTAPGADDGTDTPGPETTATDGTATDDAADRLRDLRDE